MWNILLGMGLGALMVHGMKMIKVVPRVSEILRSKTIYWKDGDKIRSFKITNTNTGPKVEIDAHEPDSNLDDFFTKNGGLGFLTLEDIFYKHIE